MNFIDICSGIGGFRTGLERNGHNCVAFAEIDKFAIQSYKAIYDTENEVELGDITTMDDSEWEQFKGNCDMIVGGTPCQSFSTAGKRLGFEDTRGTVFFSYVNAIKQIQPKYFLFENVKGLISHDKGNTIKVILKAFDEVGYDLDFEVFNSKYYDVPQNRERIYIVGKRKDLSDKPFKPVSVGKKKIDSLKAWATCEVSYKQIHPTLQTEITTQLVDVLEDEVDEKFYLLEEKTKKLTSDIALTSQREATQAGEVNQGVVIGIGHHPFSKKIEFNGYGLICPTLLAGDYKAPKTVLTNNSRIRKLTPLECWRLQGFTDEQFYKAKDSGVSNSQLYKQAGNAVTVNVVDAIVKELE